MDEARGGYWTRRAGQGPGWKALFVPPGYTGDLPKSGYFVVPMNTYGGWILARAFLTPDGDATHADALLKKTRIYPFSKRDTPPSMVYVEATGKIFDSRRPTIFVTSKCWPNW